MPAINLVPGVPNTKTGSPSRAFQTTQRDPTANGTATPAGVSAVAAIGTAIATGDASTAPTGVSSTSAIGAAVSHGDALASPAGLQTTSTLGSPLPVKTGYPRR